MTNKSRHLVNIYTPESHPGFLGKGHIARPVVAVEFSQSDPFIMLMDDMLEKKDTIPVGGPHPHAGFETVTLILEGELGVGPHAMKAGDFEMMTAGSGIVHTETIDKPMKMRILQLWLNLPKHLRKATPRVQRLSGEHVPAAISSDSTVNVYSGAFAGVTSPVKNHTPIIIAKISLKGNASLGETLPADFSGFIYVINGTVEVGESRQSLEADQVGWLNREEVPGHSALTLTAGA
ncbi:MAG TPA: pirin family protein, partial [Chryseosolibacter sp.]